MALHLATPKRRSLTNPSLCHLLSTFSNHPHSENTTTTDSNSPGNSSSSDNPSLISSYFSDIKAGLKHQSNERPTSPFSRNRTNPSIPTSKAIPMSAFVAEIRKNLSDYRERSAVPPPTESSAIPSQSRPHISFQELYKRNASAKQGDSIVNPASSGPGRKLGFETIRESLGKIKKQPGATNVEEKTGPFWSLSHYKESFKLKPSEGNVVYPVIGGTELPKSVFGREMTERTKEGEAAMKTEFVKMYSYGELGMRLKQLRPKRKGGEGWFSLQELNERLMKLREMDGKESESRIGEAFKDLRKSLYNIKRADDEKQKRTFIQRIDILDHLGRTPNFMLRPPKEHLVEKYFHPDNMSSAEKLKIELAKIRDEFKMSQSDCGSARVQVAQLTTKIKHLSSVLHKKDKHSRKGLIAMVQKRKKLLKYLRRTDWDSYCLVLSKLGLRDNPDYKN